MAKFGQGQPINLNGRPQGTVNKTTREFKELVSTVMNELQDDPRANLKSWAKENPTEFYKIASKLIPVENKTDLSVTDNQIIVIREDSKVKKQAR